MASKKNYDDVLAALIGLICFSLPGGIEVLIVMTIKGVQRCHRLEGTTPPVSLSSNFNVSPLSLKIFHSNFQH